MQFIQSISIIDYYIEYGGKNIDFIFIQESPTKFRPQRQSAQEKSIQQVFFHTEFFRNKGRYSGTITKSEVIPEKK